MQAFLFCDRMDRKLTNSVYCSSNTKNQVAVSAGTFPDILAINLVFDFYQGSISSQFTSSLPNAIDLMISHVLIG